MPEKYVVTQKKEVNLTKIKRQLWEDPNVVNHCIRTLGSYEYALVRYLVTRELDSLIEQDETTDGTPGNCVCGDLVMNEFGADNSTSVAVLTSF